MTTQPIAHKRNMSAPRPGVVPIAELPPITHAAAEAEAEPLFDVPAPAATPAPKVAGTLTEAHERLCKPFDVRLIELKPTALTGDRKRALATPYVDMRAYQTRLDRVVGPEGWSSAIVIHERGIVCSLTILGVTRSATGDFPADQRDENQATSAEAQAFKRACSAFGLGRYLYSLPATWGEYDDNKRSFIDAPGLARRLYKEAGL